MVNNAPSSKYLDKIGSWQPSIPLWEKQFCTSECLIPWEKVCERQRVLPMYQKVVKWDDSAGEEAFRNAKARYWAEINGLPCDIPLPDPDAYNDVIDHNPVLDPLLLEELNNLPSADSEEDSIAEWLSFLLVDQPVPAAGPVEVPTLNKTTEQNSIVPLNDVYHGNASFYFAQVENSDGYGDFANRPTNNLSNAVNFGHGNPQHARSEQNNTHMRVERELTGEVATAQDRRIQSYHTEERNEEP